jgi:hypothetical protein
MPPSGPPRGGELKRCGYSLAARFPQGVLALSGCGHTGEGRAARRGSSRNRRRAAPRLSEPAPGPSSRVEPAT